MQKFEFESFLVENLFEVVNSRLCAFTYVCVRVSVCWGCVALGQTVRGKGKGDALLLSTKGKKGRCYCSS